MKKVIFLEGLPGVGKTTIVRSIKKLNIDNVHVVDEIINKVEEKTPINQISYFQNDEMKLAKYEKGLIIIDRGPISTLSYNMARSEIDKTFDAREAKEWFKQFIEILEDAHNQILYLTTNKKSYYIPFNNDMDPYGSINNQQVLEQITIANCKKYAKKVTIKEYHKENMEEIINEIIS